ncbi:MAG: histidine phosphatase family protein [Planctomycetes bacterium]|nr:histidine phosphatase family protein [Planctomycetota bacterium]
MLGFAACSGRVERGGGRMLYIARHGETDWNRQKRFQARVDVPLNDTGRGQAAALRALFRERGVVFSRAWCSPLGRARETLEIVLDGSGVPWQPEPALLELSLGEFEGCLEADLQRDRGAEFDAWRARHFLEAAPGGESIGDGMVRVAGLLAALRAPASAGDVLVVGTQGANMALKAALSGDVTVSSVAGYKQANDEVDVWQADPPAFVERLRV